MKTDLFGHSHPHHRNVPGRAFFSVSAELRTEVGAVDRNRPGDWVNRPYLGLALGLLVRRADKTSRLHKTELLHHLKLIESGPFLFDLSINDSPDGYSAR